MTALSPLIFFIFTYLATSIVAGDFYKVPLTVVFMLTAFFAIATSKGRIDHRIKVFSKGASKKNLMLMIWIFIMAGAFAQSAKEMGSVEAFVNLTLCIVPSDCLLAGIFIASSLISLSVGTSVGTIVALTPIAVGLAHATGQSTPMLTAVVVGGSFFGDNMSFISDTTVVATQTQGCSMKDKFNTNIHIALPAALFVILIYALLGAGNTPKATFQSSDILKIVPYIAVLVTATIGIDVFLVLCLGILLTGIVGMAEESYDLFTWFEAMGNGISGMGELIVVSLLAGGILEIIHANGGIRYIVNKMLRTVKGSRRAEMAIAAMVSFVDMCTANNTIAIITVSGLAKEITKRFNLDNRRVASILDTFSCIMQGLIPYGAQLLMAAALSNCNPINIIPYMYYTYALAFASIMAIIFRYPRLKTRTKS